MDRTAVIDLGTNTFRLLIAEITQNGLTPIYSENQIARIGEGFAEAKRFRPNAMARAMGLLASFKEQLTRYAVTDLSVIGTSAFREAENRDLFCASILEQVGFDVDILSGEEEGRLTFLGANFYLRHCSGPMLLMDIGGGSTEFIVAEGDVLKQVISLPLGVVALTERYRLGDAARADWDALRREVRDVLMGIVPPLPKGGLFAGTAGTLTTLAAMDQKMIQYNPDQINGYLLSRAAIDAIFMQLLQTPVAERCKIPGLEKGREDLIPSGIVILQTLMDLGHHASVTVSDYGLREGVLIRRLKRYTMGARA